MSTNSNNKAENQEVDLSMISKGIGNFFRNIGTAIFLAIQFVLNHIIIIGILFAIGLGLGIYLDETQKTYDHQIMVQPNFGSTDYLYSKIDLLESKIKENDTIFLEKLGIQDASSLRKIEIRPIIDVYRFITASDQNFELLKLMAEDSDVKRIVEDKPTSKNYPYHFITFRTKDKISHEKMVDPLLAYLNDSQFLTQIKNEYVNNLKIKMQANELTLTQINNFLNGFSGASEPGKGGNMVYYNENSPLNALVETKGKLIKEQGNLRIELVATDKIIKENSNIINIENSVPFFGQKKLLLPLLLILLFVCVNRFRNFYKTQKTKHNA